MAVARAVSTDLLCNFTIAATSNPTTTQATAVITQLYKDAYLAVWRGNPAYQAYDAADEDIIIDTEEAKSVIIKEASRICQDWFNSGRDIPMPALELSDGGVKDLRKMLLQRTDVITNIRVYGEVWDDLY